jgi:hypothetical protein
MFRQAVHFGAAACVDPTQKPHGSKFNAEDGNPPYRARQNIETVDRS